MIVEQGEMASEIVLGCEMQGISNRVRVLAVDGRMIGEAMSALAVGALLGVLVAAPYDRIFGISQPFYTVLQAAMGTATLTALTYGWSNPSAFRPRDLDRPGTEEAAFQRPKAGRVPEHAIWARIHDLLATLAHTGSAFRMHVVRHVEGG
jgi:hypothetical protein